MNLKPYDRDTCHDLAKCSSSTVNKLMPESALYAAARVALYLMLRMVEDATAERVLDDDKSTEPTIAP
jgi:hypothetical protein